MLLGARRLCGCGVAWDDHVTVAARARRTHVTACKRSREGHVKCDWYLPRLVAAASLPGLHKNCCSCRQAVQLTTTTTAITANHRHVREPLRSPRRPRHLRAGRPSQGAARRSRPGQRRCPHVPPAVWRKRRRRRRRWRRRQQHDARLGEWLWHHRPHLAHEAAQGQLPHAWLQRRRRLAVLCRHRRHRQDGRCHDGPGRRQDCHPAGSVCPLCPGQDDAGTDC